ncbi:M57 family metalloprotease [Corallococcus terminator]
MFKQVAILAVSCSALLVGCGSDAQTEQEETLSNLIEAGFPAKDIQVVDGAVLVGGDGLVSLAASREMLQVPAGSMEQHRSVNIAGPGVTKICVNPTTWFDGYLLMSQGLDLAIANYNALGLRITFARGPTTGCTANIVAKTNMLGNGNSISAFPANGLPGWLIDINIGVNAYPLNVSEQIITHELGHTLGLRHSDYYNTSVSCGYPYPAPEPDPENVGAIHIPGTPQLATPGGSVMNACPTLQDSGNFTNSDIFALTYLYGW